MGTIKLILFKLRKSIYLVMELIQGIILPPSERTGKYFEDPNSATNNQIFPASQALKSEAYLKTLREIEAKGLFILGNARNGTTILRRILNSSDEVMLLGEANLYQNFNEISFREDYNNKHKIKGLSEKGIFISKPLLPEKNALITLNRLGKNYDYCGEKTALDFSSDHDAYLDFQAQYFLNSQYLFVIQEPASSVLSMQTMVPNADQKKLFLSWLKSMELIIQCLGIFPKTNLILQENIQPELIERLETKLKINIPYPKAHLDPGKQPSALNNNELPDSLQSSFQLIEACDAIYQFIKSAASPITFQIEGDTPAWLLFQKQLREIRIMIDLIETLGLDSGQTTLGLAALKDPELLIYLTGLDENEVHDFDILETYNKTSAKKALSFSSNFSNEQIDAMDDNLMKNWALETLLIQVIQVSKDTSTRIIYDHLLKIDPKHKEGNRFYTKDLKTAKEIDKAEFLSSQKKFDLALEKLEAIHKKSSELPRVNYMLGFVHHLKGNFEEAVEYYSKSLKLSYPEFWVMYNRGGVYLEMGEPELAKADLDRAHQIDPEHNGVLMLREKLERIS